MGRRRAFAALVVAATSLGADAPGELPLREARWIAPEARFAQLSSYPSSCWPDRSQSVVYGMVAFRDPLLLGGQAARAGISCASCHRGGRGNPAFVFPGVSGAPGTADITASLFSSHRGDGIFNPIRIPDLTHDTPKVSRSEPQVLEKFIRGLIVEEFDGAEPPGTVLTGLADFVRSFDPKECTTETGALFIDLELRAEAFAAAFSALEANDRETAYAMIRGGRSTLGRMAERFQSNPKVLGALESDDQILADLQKGLRDGRSIEEVGSALMKLRLTNYAAMYAETLQSDSLYNPERLKAALNAARTP